MTLNKFSNGQLANANSVNENFNFVGTVSAIGILQASMVGRKTIVYEDSDQDSSQNPDYKDEPINAPSIYDNCIVETPIYNTSLSTVGSITSTATYTQNGLVAFGDKYDDFSDSSINTGSWGSFVGSTVVSGTPSVSEGAGSIEINSIGAGTNVAYLYTTFNMGSEPTEFVFGFNGSARSNAASAIIQISNNVGSVNLLTLATNSTIGNDEISGWMRIVYNPSNTVDAWILYKDRFREDNEGVSDIDRTAWVRVATNLDVSSITPNKYLRFYTTAINGAQSKWVVYPIAYAVNGGSSTNYTWISPKTTFTQNLDSGLVYARTYPATNNVIGSFSLNNGSSWTSDVYKNFLTTTNTGSVAQIGVTVTKPSTIVAGSENIPTLYGAIGIFN